MANSAISQAAGPIGPSGPTGLAGLTGAQGPSGTGFVVLTAGETFSGASGVPMLIVRLP